MWRLINVYRCIAGIADPKCSKVRMRSLLAERRYLMKQIVNTFTKVMPYEKAKLAAFTISGDPKAPLHVEYDYSKLTDNELEVLARIIPKLGGASSRYRRRPVQS
jgi:hypothetical protein